MASPYTHRFLVTIGGQTVSGHIEFNEDGKMGYKTDGPVEWTEQKYRNRFHALLDEFKNIFDIFGDIEKIELEKE